MNEILAIVRPAPPRRSIPPPQEIEIKLAASPAMLENLRHHPLLGEAAPRVAQASTYFDTPTQALAAGGASLRLRRRAGACEQTLKLNGVGARQGRGPVARGEWNQPLPGEATQPDPAASAFRALGAMQGTAPLAPYAEVAVEREAAGAPWRLAHRTGLRHRKHQRARPAAAGAGRTGAGTARGRMADLFALALELPLGPDLRWSLATKAQRARCMGQDPAPLHAQPCGWMRASAPGAAFRR
jgi:inorganic triphosphatase YgiF